MKIRSKRFLSLTILTLVLCIGGSVSALQAVDKPPKEVLDAAVKGVKQFTQNGPIESFPAFNKEEVQKAVVKQGYRVFTIPPNQLIHNVNSRLNQMIVPTGMWRFTVEVHEKPLFLVTVAQIDGMWQAVAIGAAGLAKEVHQVMKSFPRGQGYEFRFVRIFEAKSDLLEISRDKEVLGFAPLKSAVLALDMNSVQLEPGTLMYDSELIEPLRSVISRQLTKKANNSIEED